MRRLLVARVVFALRLLLVTSAVLAATASGAYAATIAVDTTDDTFGSDTHCSLREAVRAANINGPAVSGAGECVAGTGNDTIVLGAGMFKRLSATADDSNAAGDLDVTDVTTITGLGAELTTISAQGKDRVIDVQPAGNLTLQGVKITGGLAANGANASTAGTSGGNGENGGGIRNSGTLTILDSQITDNRAGNGGAGALGTGTDGSLGTNGTNGGQGSGGFGGGGGSGGGIFSTGSLTLTRVLMSLNFAGNGANGAPGSGGQGGAATGTSGLGGNGGKGFGGGGGFGGAGGGIATQGGSLTIDQSRISLNTAGTGGNGALGQGGAGGLTTASSAAGSGGTGGDGHGGNGAAGGLGGGIRTFASPAAITRSLIDGNSTGLGGNGANGNGGPGGESVSNPSSAMSGIGGNGFGGAGGAGGEGAGVQLTAAGTLANATVTANVTGSGGHGGNSNGGNGGATAAGPHGPGGSGAGGTGGAVGAGGGVATSGSVITIVHATLAANGFGTSGAGGVGTGGTPSGSAGNGATGAEGTGGAVASGNQTTLSDSIAIDNGMPGCQNTLKSGGHDISVADPACPGLDANPLLGPLADNGGPTLTRKPAAGSPALDMVPSTGAGCEATDQRLVARPFGAACDIGAYELAPPGLAVGEPTAVTETGATLHGIVTPNAQASSYHFDYGTTTGYGASTAVQQLAAGIAPVAASETIAGLAPGTTYHVRLLGTNPDGTGTSADRTFTTTGTPAGGGGGSSGEGGGGGGGGAGGDSVAPIFLSAIMNPTTFAVDTKGTAEKLVTAKVRRGTTFRYRLSEDARVVFTIQRRKGKRYVQARRFTKTSNAGANTKRFSGQIGKRALRAGRYRATLIATDAAGNHSNAKRLRFRIKR